MKSAYPETHILNPEFRYTPAAATNVKLTFDRIRAQQMEQQPKVSVLRKRK